MEQIKEPLDRFRPEIDDRDRLILEMSDNDYFRAAIEAELGPME